MQLGCTLISRTHKTSPRSAPPALEILHCGGNDRCTRTTNSKSFGKQSIKHDFIEVLQIHGRKVIKLKS